MHIKRLITLYLLATLLILCSISYAQEASNGHKLITDRDTENLLGPVKKVTNFFGESSSIASIFTYRSNGYRESMELPKYNLLMTYDEKGRMLTSEKITPSGRQVSINTVYDDSKHTYTVYSNSSNPPQVSGELTETGYSKGSSHYSPTGDFIGYGVYEYDKNGLLVGWTNYNINSIPVKRNEFVHDTNGHIKEINIYEASGKDHPQLTLSSKECFVFGVDGRLLEIRDYRGSDQVLCKIILYSDYDKYENWLKRTESYVAYPEIRSMSPIQIRKIEYHE
ncbi:MULTISPECIES: hypothetical protein [Pelosinus]|jgi:hypothetical protein|uniref:Uncharacterized protein n=1 Tax=Pelosinus fermentans B4 TaxID=1149862 RepID=I8RK90_9FIRM|nr:MULTISPECIES: hypothetical protein [Pelosinus]EIW18740.1 hypothetical protein FB4_0265 [Pelosinus fermentans B4]EIW22050.1 hypothetical protein FA11_0857 [Pelosinus fermentans A11]OAM95097.1 hypothetical protein FR7_03118 [Pelosinus fermentans DSM 17108]SDR23275.1 hypothetical protein SAMN04515679_3250 [Pelosinus fermentans]